MRVVDGGPGLVDRANLFVPLYTTKVGGSGIGLALGREIIRAHGGELTLDNREDATGSVATIRLPGGGGGADGGWGHKLSPGSEGGGGDRDLRRLGHGLDRARWAADLPQDCAERWPRNCSASSLALFRRGCSPA